MYKMQDFYLPSCNLFFIYEFSSSMHREKFQYKIEMARHAYLKEFFHSFLKLFLRQRGTCAMKMTRMPQCYQYQRNIKQTVFISCIFIISKTFECDLSISVSCKSLAFYLSKAATDIGKDVRSRMFGRLKKFSRNGAQSPEMEEDLDQVRRLGHPANISVDRIESGNTLFSRQGQNYLYPTADETEPGSNSLRSQLSLRTRIDAPFSRRERITDCKT